MSASHKEPLQMVQIFEIGTIDKGSLMRCLEKLTFQSHKVIYTWSI